MREVAPPKALIFIIFSRNLHKSSCAIYFFKKLNKIKFCAEPEKLPVRKQKLQRTRSHEKNGIWRESSKMISITLIILRVCCKFDKFLIFIFDVSASFAPKFAFSSTPVNIISKGIIAIIRDKILLSKHPFSERFWWTIKVWISSRDEMRNNWSHFSINRFGFVITMGEKHFTVCKNVSYRKMENCMILFLSSSHKF